MFSAYVRKGSIKRITTAVSTIFVVLGHLLFLSSTVYAVPKLEKDTKEIHKDVFNKMHIKKPQHFNLSKRSQHQEKLLVHTEAFQVLDDGNLTDDIYVQFGHNVEERLLFEKDMQRFALTDDIFVEGSIETENSVTAGSVTVTNLKNCFSVTTNEDGVLTCGSNSQRGFYMSPASNSNSEQPVVYAPQLESEHVVIRKLNQPSSSIEPKQLHIGYETEQGKTAIGFGEGDTIDISLYREQAGELKTDGSFTVEQNFAADSLQVAGSSLEVSNEGDVVLNKQNEFADLQVKSWNNDHMLFVDASLDRIGVGTSQPAEDLDVHGTVAAEEVHVRRLTNCTALQTDANGQIICANGASGHGGSGLFAQFYDGRGGKDISALEPTPLSWSKQVRKDAGFVHSPTSESSRVYLSARGWYRILYSVSYTSGSNEPKRIRCRVRMNGGKYIPYSSSYSYAYYPPNTTDGNYLSFNRYNRYAGNEWRTNTATFLFETTSDHDYYEVVCNGDGSSENAYTLAEESWTTVEKIRD